MADGKDETHHESNDKERGLGVRETFAQQIRRIKSEHLGMQQIICTNDMMHERMRGQS